MVWFRRRCEDLKFTNVVFAFCRCPNFTMREIPFIKKVTPQAPTRTLSLPLLNLLASLRVRQDEDNGEVAACPSLPPQLQVTKHIMQTWTLHEQMLRNPPTDRMRGRHNPCFIYQSDSRSVLYLRFFSFISGNKIRKVPKRVDT